MKSFEALQKSYEKEMALAEKHKQNAADIKKEMDIQRGNASNKKINALNLTGQEYDRFLRLLDTGKKTVMEAVELALGERTDGVETEKTVQAEESLQNREEDSEEQAV